MAATSGPIEVTAAPSAPTDQPEGATIDGNVYTVAFTAPGSPVTLTDKAQLSTVYLRAATTRQPAPVFEHRADGSGSWQPLSTSRGGTDFYVASFAGPGQYAVAIRARAGGDSGLPVLPLVVGGVLLLLVVAVVVVRLRAPADDVES